MVTGAGEHAGHVEREGGLPVRRSAGENHQLPRPEPAPPPIECGQPGRSYRRRLFETCCEFRQRRLQCCASVRTGLHDRLGLSHGRAAAPLAERHYTEGPTPFYLVQPWGRDRYRQATVTSIHDTAEDT